VKSVYLTGHSLGGALAYLIAGMMALDKAAPAGITVFAPARPATSVLARLFDNTMPGRAYHYGNDPVPFVPLWPCVQPRALTALGESKPDAIECHYLRTIMPAIPIDNHTGPFLDLELASLCQQSYEEAPAFQISDWLDHVCVATMTREDAIAIAFRGTVPKDLRTVIEDLRCLPGFDLAHRWLGPVPHGFLNAALKIYPLVTHWLAGA